MLLIKIEDLKAGMRLAKPVYSNEGVLLVDRNHALSESAIRSIQGFNLWGIYVLEPAEPLPPMTESELEFEYFQTMTSFDLKSELNLIVKGEKEKNLPNIVISICRNYGSLDDRITFLQSLRSPDDHVYKHTINVAMLSALMTNKLGLDKKDQQSIVQAALYHDIGKLFVPSDLLHKPEKLNLAELKDIRESQKKGYDIIKSNMNLSSSVKRYIIQLNKELDNKMYKEELNYKKLLEGTQILRVADMFDTLTSVRTYKQPMTEYDAINYLLERSDEFPEKIIDSLIESIKILPLGACVELSNGDTGLVIRENLRNPLRPVILTFNQNQIFDMSDNITYHQTKIKGIMKTMDNRFVIKKCHPNG